MPEFQILNLFANPANLQDTIRMMATRASSPEEAKKENVPTTWRFLKVLAVQINSQTRQTIDRHELISAIQLTQKLALEKAQVQSQIMREIDALLQTPDYVEIQQTVVDQSHLAFTKYVDPKEDLIEHGDAMPSKLAQADIDDIERQIAPCVQHLEELHQQRQTAANLSAQAFSLNSDLTTIKSSIKWTIASFSVES